MWESGDSLSLVTDALSGLQDLRPNLRGSLAWRLVKTWQRIEIPQRAPQLDCAVLSLGFTKTSQRAGAADSVTTRVESLCRRFFVWKSQAISLKTNLFKNRTTFSARALTHALPHWTFIRRGGATMYFTRNPQMDWLRSMGRWSSDRTVRIYVNDGLAQLAQMRYDVRTDPLKKPHLAYHARTHESKGTWRTALVLGKIPFHTSYSCSPVGLRA